jgi:uncharacterized membrane protein
MSWSLRYAVKSYLLSAIWTAPVAALLLEQLTFRVVYYADLDLGWIPGFVHDHDGAVALMDYVIGSASGFTVFTFGSLLVAIQVASGQLTPRIIATALLRDQALRRAVGVFVYSLTLAVSIKVRINNNVPDTLISIAGILGLLNVVVFLFLIDYAARLLRPVTIVSRIAEAGFKVIAGVYPEMHPAVPGPPPPTDLLGRAERTIPRRGNSGIVIAVNLRALVVEARRADAVIELVPSVGDFVAQNEPLFHVYGAGAARIDERRLQGQVAFGRERTLEQDSAFAFRVIVDIAIKALSPAINDPTTAVLAIDQLYRLLRTVAGRKLHDERILDAEGRLRMIFHTPNWSDFVHLTFSEIRHYGAGNLQIARRLRAMIETLLNTVPASRLPPLREELALLDRTIETLYAFPEELALARIPDTQGLGGGSHSRETQPLVSRAGAPLAS